MTTSELLAAHLKNDLGMITWHLADFSEADMLVRPCSTANHGNWQVGHAVSSTGRLLEKVDSGFVTTVSSELAEKYTKESSKVDDASKFATLEELRSAIAKLADAAAAWVSEMPQEKLDAKSPDWAKDWAPTNGLLLAGIASHVQMHIGQLQVIRRRLGKPILF